MSNVVKVVCSRGHRKALVCQLGPPGTTFPESMEVVTLPCGTLLAAPRPPRTPRDLPRRLGILGVLEGNPVHGGNKLRLRCPVRICPLDLPWSWDTLSRHGYARRLVSAEAKNVELAALAAILTG